MTTELCVLFAVTVNHWLCLEVTLAAAVGQKVGYKLGFGLGLFLESQFFAMSRTSDASLPSLKP